MKFNDCLVMTAWKPQPQPGKAPLTLVLSVWGWQLCPCPVLHLRAPACTPHIAPFRGLRGLLPRLLWPRAGCPWRRVQLGCRAAPRLPGQHPALCPVQSPVPAAAGRAGLRAVRMGEASAGCSERPAEGGARANPLLCALSAARGGQPSTWAPAPGPAVPAEPSEVPATSGQEVHW